MQDRVVTRMGDADDLEAALAVISVAAEARDGVAVSVPLVQRSEASLTADSAFLAIAEDGGQVVGLASGMQGLADDGRGPPIPGLAHISAVFVAPERWGEGIGQALVDLVMEQARSRGYQRVQLWTHADNRHARALYEGKGFVASGREQVLDGRSIVHYERDL